MDFSDDASELHNGPDLLGASWGFLRKLLSSQFVNLPNELPETPQRYTAADASQSTLVIEPSEHTTRVRLELPHMSPALAHRLFSYTKERASLRSILSAMPDPVLRIDPDKKVTWYNAPYLTFCREMGEEPDTLKPFKLTKSHYTTPSQFRYCFEKNGTTRWFEIFTTPDNSGNVMIFAKNIDLLVEAEIAQRNFVQTLTKTFAHLPIGLAVFDRNRQLVLFNPALVDLTNLPSNFLSARPNLLSFFDHLRENRMIPEPKNYQTWRAQLADVIAAAKNDRYSETWNLPSGLTYKITVVRIRTGQWPS